MLYQTELIWLVPPIGFEPMTHELKARCSNQAELKRHCGNEGIRTPDFLLAKQTLYQLSYVPVEDLIGVEPPRLLRSTVFKTGSVANRIALPYI